MIWSDASDELLAFPETPFLRTTRHRRCPDNGSNCDKDQVMRKTNRQRPRHVHINVAFSSAHCALLPAFTAENARSRQEEKRRGHEQKHAETGENSDDLSSMPDDRGPGVAELVLTRPSIVVAQEKIVVERLETIPAEDVLASLAHHLRATFFPFDQNMTNRAPLDRG